MPWLAYSAMVGAARCHSRSCRAASGAVPPSHAQRAPDPGGWGSRPRPQNECHRSCYAGGTCLVAWVWVMVGPVAEMQGGVCAHPLSAGTAVFSVGRASCAPSPCRGEPEPSRPATPKEHPTPAAGARAPDPQCQCCGNRNAGGACRVARLGIVSHQVILALP